MSSYSATDAAFEGYRLTRERPKAVLYWAGFNLVLRALLAVVLIGLGGEHLMALENMAPDGASSDEAIRDLIVLGPLYLALLPLYLILSAVMAGAVFRALLRPEDSAYGYMRFGADEVRLILLTLAYWVMCFFLVMAVALGASMVTAVGSLVLAPIAPLLALAVVLFSLGLLFYVAVRLSLAGVITFAERKVALFDSWRLTRGQFWSLFGIYFLMVASAVVVLLLAMLIFTALAVVAAGGDLGTAGAIFKPDVSSLEAYFSPTMVAYTIFSSFLYAIYYPVVFAPAVVVYKALSRGDAASETPRL